LRDSSPKSCRSLLLQLYTSNKESDWKDVSPKDLLKFDFYSLFVDALPPGVSDNHRYFRRVLANTL